MKHVPGPWELSSSGQFVRKDTKGAVYQVICEVRRNWQTSKETQIANAQRIVACVNAMEGIENPQLLRKYWDEQMFNQVKSNHVKTMLLTQEELQKLGEQYKNQEETPYIETSQPKDAPTKADTEELLSYASKYERLKAAVDHFVFIVENRNNMHVHKDSVILSLLKDEIK